METHTCEDPKKVPRCSVELTKAVTMKNFPVSEQATESYGQLALGSGPGEVYDEVGTAGTW
jgi:hypothetical protein